MKSKKIINLIEKYIEIYKILYECTNAINLSNNLTELKQIHSLCLSTLELKTKFENIFRSKNIYDESFLVLKKQLNNSITSNSRFFNKKNFSIENLYLKKSFIENYIENI